MNDNIHLSNDIESAKIRENLRTPKISVIVPVYRVEQYLPQCIESILNQTFTDFELLLIDDGSPDNSGLICDQYAIKDSRIRVFHKENGGVSSARNFGLENARGQWITFVDSDDLICSESFMNLINSDINSCQILILKSVSYCSVYDEYSVNYPIDDVFKNREIDSLSFFLSTGFLRGSVCGCFFSRTFLLEKNIFFLEHVINAEDSYFYATAFYFSQNIKIFDIDYYVVIKRAGSASRDWTYKRLLKLVDSLSLFRNDMDSRRIEFDRSPIHNLFIYSVISSFFNVVSSEHFKKSLFLLFRKELIRNKFYPIRLNANASLHKKIFLLNKSIFLYGAIVILKNTFKYTE